jgi:hypothetical protein
MQPDNLRVTAEITRVIGSREERQLAKLYESGEKMYGLIDQFQWMPCIVTGRTVDTESVTYDLLMVSK